MVVKTHEIVYQIDNKPISLKIVNQYFSFEKLIEEKTSVHILASGPSIKDYNLTALSDTPVIFVNGSITLINVYSFKKIAAYVISDPRFIKHNLELLVKNYTGQYPLYITQRVVEQLWQDKPDFVARFHELIFIIFAVDRPISDPTRTFLDKLSAKLKPKLRLKNFINSPFYRIKDDIGVSLDIRYGFVEAGTVAFVATQLAFSLGYREIHLYGIDLLNSQTPRFYENNQNAAPSKLDAAITNRIVPSFEWAAQVYQRQGVTIYNHSPVSKDLFQHIPYLP